MGAATLKNIASEDQAFLDAFERQWHDKEKSLGNTICVVVRLDDDLHYCFNGESEKLQVVGAAYHALKRVAHLPIRALMLRASGADDAMRPSLPAAVLDELAAMAAAKPSADKILGTTGEFWEATTDPLNWRQVQEFAEAVHAPVQQLIRAAAEIEVRQLHEAVTELEARTPADAWQTGYFCVVAGMEPRYKALSKQYFSAYLRRKGHARGRSQHQLVYAEGDHDLDSVFELIAKRAVNRTLAEVFTGSATGLEEDILGDAAAIAIERIFKD